MAYSMGLRHGVTAFRCIVEGLGMFDRLVDEPIYMLKIDAEG